MESSVAQRKLLRNVCDGEHTGIVWCRPCKDVIFLKMNSREEQEVEKIQVQGWCSSLGEQDIVYYAKDEVLEPFKNEVGSAVLNQFFVSGLDWNDGSEGDGGVEGSVVGLE